MWLKGGRLSIEEGPVRLKYGAILIFLLTLSHSCVCFFVSFSTECCLAFAKLHHEAVTAMYSLAVSCSHIREFRGFWKIRMCIWRLKYARHRRHKFLRRTNVGCKKAHACSKCSHVASVLSFFFVTVYKLTWKILFLNAELFRDNGVATLKSLFLLTTVFLSLFFYLSLSSFWALGIVPCAL